MTVRWDPFMVRKEILIEDRLSTKPMLGLSGRLRGTERLCPSLGREEGFQGLRWPRKQIRQK